MATGIDRQRIGAAHKVIKPYIRVTPVLEVSGADFGLSPFSLILKLELLQHSGSFKARGAFVNLLTRPIPEAGVVAASGGNHGAAVAYAAMRLGVRAKIFVPTVSSPAKIIGVEPRAAPTLTEALRAGRPVDTEAGGIAADSLAPRHVGELMFPIAQAYVDHVVLVSDAAIRRAQDALWAAVRIVAEPGGAAALAALLDGGYTPTPGERVGVVVSGGNTTAVDFGDPAPG